MIYLNMNIIYSNMNIIYSFSRNIIENDMMAIGIHNLSKTIREGKAEAWDLPVPNCDAVMRQTMLINDDVI